MITAMTQPFMLFTALLDCVFMAVPLHGNGAACRIDAASIHSLPQPIHGQGHSWRRIVHGGSIHGCAMHTPAHYLQMKLQDWPEPEVCLGGRLGGAGI
jgi:hypothetical protein